MIYELLLIFSLIFFSKYFNALPLPISLRKYDGKPEVKNPPNIFLGPDQKVSPFAVSNQNPGFSQLEISPLDFKNYNTNDVFG